MNISIQAVKFTMDEDQKKFLDQKFKRIEYAEDLITDVQCIIKLDKKFIYEIYEDDGYWFGNSKVNEYNYF